MKKHALAVLVTCISVCIICPPRTSAQIYVEASIDVLPDGSNIQAECQTRAVVQPSLAGSQTQLVYYQFGVQCAAETPNGIVSCPDQEDDADNPQGECDWNIPVQPGFHYEIEGEHSIWFYSLEYDAEVQPHCVEGGYFNSHPCGPPYDDFQAYTKLSPIGNPQRYLQDERTLPIPSNSVLDQRIAMNAPNYVLPVTTTAYFNAIIVTPSESSLYQTQRVNLTSTLDSPDNSIIWCPPLVSPYFSVRTGCGSQYQGQGQLDTNAGSSVLYTAPNPIMNSPATAYVCAADAEDTGNHACAEMDLAELSIELSYTSSLPGSPAVPLTPYELFPMGSSSPNGGQGTFTAVITPPDVASLPASAVTTSAVTWANNGNGSPWILTTLNGSDGSGTPVGQTTSEDSTQSAYFLIAPLPNSTNLLTANALVDFSANGTVNGDSAAPLSASVTISVNPGKRPWIITFPQIKSQLIDITLPLVATATCPTDTQDIPAVSFSSATPDICTVSGTNVNLGFTLGTCTILANQPEDQDCAPAQTVPRSFLVGSQPPPAEPPPLPFDPNGLFPDQIIFPPTNIFSSTPPTVPLSLTFGTATTLGNMAVVTQGTGGLDFINAGTGTCTAGVTYVASASCTVNVTFTPTLVGNRYGAVLVQDNAGNVIAKSYLQGTGLGPQMSFQPGTESTVPTSALNGPSGVSVDGNGNVYIADTGNNRILKETLSAGSYAESTMPNSYLNSAHGVAVDGSGSAYIVDSVDSQVLMEMPSAGSYTEYSVPTSAQYSPYDVAVDGSGNVYITNTNNQVLKETLSAGSYTESTVPTSTLHSPQGVAVDGSGNIYIADTNNGRVLKETLSAGSYTESTVPTSALNGPQGVAVDGSGNVYIADTGNNRVLMETLSAGSYSESTVQSSALNGPAGIAVDGSGNVYIADTLNNRVLKEDFADPPTLTFATTAVGSTSIDSPQVVTVENVGNAALNFPALNTGNNPGIAANFTLNSNGASVCPLVSLGSSTAGTLAAGQSCLLPISFAPTTVGTLNGTLVLTDNSLNAVAPGYATQSIALSGSSTGNTPQTITFGSISAQSANSILGLTATASSGLPVSFTSITPDVCPVSGSAVSLLAAGTCTIQANQAGNDVYAAAPAVTQGITVIPVVQTITFGAIQTQYVNITLGLTATASSGLPVSYISTTPTICAVSESINLLMLLPGTCAIEANQAGNAAYAAAPMVTQSFAVTVNNSPAPNGNFGTVPVGTASPAVTVTFTIGTADTLGSTAVLTQGGTGLDFADAGTGTCTAGTTYNVGDTCTVNITFTPKFAGTRYGGVVLNDSSGNVIETAYLQGIGAGPQLDFLPGTQSTVATNGLYAPGGVAVDGSGNVYIADTSAASASTYYVYKETLQANGSYNQRVLQTSSLSGPAGVAVDGSGNVYIADTSNSRVLKETLSASGYSESTVSTSTLNTPYGVAVDGSGNVYIADTGNFRVLKETPVAGSYTESVVADSTSSGVLSPMSIAVDGSGNVYIADTSYNQVVKEIPSAGGYTTSMIGSGLNTPWGVAVDGSGNVYIADTYNNRIVKETLSAGSYTQSVVSANSLSYPWGVAVDGSGNVYIADSNNSRVLKEDLADIPSLSFANTSVGVPSTDSPQTVTVQNIGNAQLNFSVISYPTDFPEAPLVSTDCTASSTVQAGGSCTLSIDFVPSVPISSYTPPVFSESITLTSNTLNVAGSTQSASVTGMELEATPSVNLTTSSTASVIGVPVIFTATVSPVTSTSLTPTGTVTFYSGTTPLSSVTLNSSGVATYTTSSLPVGAFSITAVFSGDSIFPTATSSVLTQTISPIVSLSGFGGTNTGTVNVGSASSSIPLTVTFNGGETLGSIAVLTQGAPNQDFTNAGGGTCAVGTAYVANSTCTVNVVFQPQHPGTRYGAIVLRDGNGNVLASSYLQGTGQGAQQANLSAAPISVASGFSAVSGGSVNDVAIDGFGNLYIADNNSGYVYEETLQSDGSYTQSVFASGFQVASGVAVDGAGNIYVVDNGSQTVYKETPLPNGGVTQSVVVSGSGYFNNSNPNPDHNYGSPYAATVDGSGNVFVADADGLVYEAILQPNGTYVPTMEGSGYGVPWAVAVDGSDNIYVADLNGSVYEEQLQSDGSYIMINISETISVPWGIAVDGFGNVYIAGYSSNATVLMEALQSPGSYTETAIYNPYSSDILGFATNLVVDGNGNVFVGDFDTENVYEFVNSGTQ